MIWITHAHYVDAYRIHIEFSDQSSAVLDLKEIIWRDSRPLFQALREVDQFKHFQVAGDTIVWDNGLDLAPEFLYQLSQQTAVAASQG